MDIDSTVKKMIANGKKSRYGYLLLGMGSPKQNLVIRSDHAEPTVQSRPVNSEILAAFNCSSKAFVQHKLFRSHVECVNLAFNDGLWKGICSVKHVYIKEYAGGLDGGIDTTKNISMNAHRIPTNVFTLAGIASELLLQNQNSAEGYFEHEDFQKAVLEERKSFFIPLALQGPEWHLAAKEISEQLLNYTKLRLSTFVPWTAISALAKALLARRILSGKEATLILDQASTKATGCFRSGCNPYVL